MYGRRRRQNSKFFRKKKQLQPRPPKAKVDHEPTLTAPVRKETVAHISSSSSDSEEESFSHPYSSLVESLFEPESESSESDSEHEIKRQKLGKDSGEDLASGEASGEEDLDPAPEPGSGHTLGEDSIQEGDVVPGLDGDVVVADQRDKADEPNSDLSDVDEDQECNSESDVLAEEEENDEQEEDPSDAAGNAELILSDDDMNADVSEKEKCPEIPDIYKSHLEKDITDMVKTLEKNKPQIFKSREWPTLGKLKYMCRVDQSDTANTSHPILPPRPIPNPNSDGLEKLRVRRLIVGNWIKLKTGKNVSGGDIPDDGDTKMFSSLQKELFTLFSSYGDVLYCDKNAVNNSAEIKQAYCLHAVNHVLRARMKVYSHTTKLKQLTPEQCENAEYRDQGITRPRVLILLPFKETALRVVSTMMELLQRGKKFQVGNKHRFKEEFSKNEEDEDIRDERRFSKKPEDHRRLFAGNVDEHFRIGIALLQSSVRLYAPFYSSEIIVASPLGIRTVMGAEGEEHYEHDFLSSIEMVILDHTDVFLMQNWEHILHIFEHLNLTPKDSHGVDFSRVRNFALDGLSKYYRQTIAISSVSSPQISSLFTKFCWNYKGAVSSDQLEEKGTICQIAKQLPMVFHKLMAASLVDAAEVRFRFFIDRIYRQYKNANMSHTLIYVAQYFDFVRLRNFMTKECKSGAGPVFTHINDYSEVREAAKAKRLFFTGKSPLLLYTERHHFYNRPRIRGMRNLVFYELPTYPRFFTDMCSMVRETFGGGSIASSGSVLVMYSRHDARKLAAIVGLARCKELLSSDKSVHMFVTGATTES